MQETINVRIKMFPGEPPRPATTKVFLDKKKLGRNARPLEPGEIVEMPRAMAEEFLAHLPYELEMTMEPANRPLAFENERQAAMTSTQNTMINRSELIKAAHQAEVAKVREDMEKRNELVAREEAIARREAELGIGEPAEVQAEEPEDDYVPKNNAVVQEDLDNLRKEVERKAEEDSAVTEASAPPPRKRRGRPPKNPQPGM